MYTLPEMLVLAFSIGLTGALTPGPTLVATVRASIEYGWISGPVITAGHCLVELAVFVLILAGLVSVAGDYAWLISAAGGIALILFGIITLESARNASLTGVIRNGLSESGGAGYRNIKTVFFSGILTSMANPFFWVWWLTVGSAMVIAGLKGGIILGAAFLVGHWVADISWYTVVSVTLHRGRTVITDTWYRRIIAFCGVFLAMFGAWFTWVALNAGK